MDTNNQVHNSYVESPEYIAPELFQNDPHYTKSVDIYAFGVLMYSVMTVSLLYQGQTSIFVIMNEVVNNRRPTIPEFIPDYLKSLIQRCWSQIQVKDQHLTKSIKI